MSDPEHMMRVYVRASDRRVESTDAGREVVRVLCDAGFDLVDDPAEPYDVVVLLGGDGFLMQTLRDLDYPEAPIFGLNFGTVGFLMNSQSVLAQLGTVLRDHRTYRVEHRLLAARIRFEDGREIERFAFNDIVLERQTGQAVRLRMTIDGQPFNRYAGDGFVVSTPAGSTAYNLAAGGPAVHPAVDSTVLTPLYPHRAEPFHSVEFSLVLPSSARIDAVSEEPGSDRRLRVVADGDPHPDVASISIVGADRKVTILRTFDREFTGLLSPEIIGQARG